MDIKQTVALYLSGDIYNADSLTNNLTDLIRINNEVLLQAGIQLSAYSKSSPEHNIEHYSSIFNDYVTLLSISSYLVFLIKKLGETKGGAAE